jgi:outer membrane protein TolC
MRDKAARHPWPMIALPHMRNALSLALVLALGLSSGCVSFSQPSPPARPDPPPVASSPGPVVAAPANPVVPAGAAAVPDTLPPPRPVPPPQERFTLFEAIQYALAWSPRLAALRAEIDRAKGQEQAAFSPYLPQFDLLTRWGDTSANLSPGAPGPTGAIEPTSLTNAHTYTQAELQLQWLLYDFGRTAGRYNQAVSRERITELQHNRAQETVALEVASAYLEALLADSNLQAREEAVVQALAVLADSRARREGGVVTRDAVLRAEVQLSEAREGVLLARQAGRNALARLNTLMGRQIDLPLQVVEFAVAADAPASLSDLLETAIRQRREIAVAGQAVASAQAGEQAAHGDFFPKFYVLGSLGRVDGPYIAPGWQRGVGIHVEQALYHGGKEKGQLHAARAEVQETLARTRAVLDTVTLEVTLAHTAAVTARARIDLVRPAIEQAVENLRLVRQRFRNGNATPTDVVDAETALTRARERMNRARFDYQLALAQLDYAVGTSPIIAGK